MIPDRNDEKLMVEFIKHVRYDETSTGKGNYIAMHYKSLYEV